jgi:hypothetical protein
VPSFQANPPQLLFRPRLHQERVFFCHSMVMVGSLLVAPASSRSLCGKADAAPRSLAVSNARAIRNGVEFWIQCACIIKNGRGYYGYTTEPSWSSLGSLGEQSVFETNNKPPNVGWEDSPRTTRSESRISYGKRDARDFISSCFMLLA